MRKRKLYEKLLMIPVACMAASLCLSPLPTNADLSDEMTDVECDLATATSSSKSINGTGTFHDNSWDGVPIKKVDATKDDSKKNLVHDYKVVKGKVVDTVTGKTV